jgi:hypothetical protein
VGEPDSYPGQLRPLSGVTQLPLPTEPPHPQTYEQLLLHFYTKLTFSSTSHFITVSLIEDTVYDHDVITENFHSRKLE